MKRLLASFCILAILFMWAMTAHAATVLISWEPSPDTTVTGYIVHISTNLPVESAIVATIPTSSTNATWSGLVVGQSYYCYVTATNTMTYQGTNTTSMESDPSNTIWFKKPSPNGRINVKSQ